VDSHTGSGRLMIYVQFNMVVFPFEKQVQIANIVVAFKCRFKNNVFMYCVNPVVKVSV
jgi:hypothetical protein